MTVAVAAAALLPAGVANDGPVLCPFRRATGRPCPACGLTRSWNAFARLRFRRSLEFHPFGPATFVGALAVVFAERRGRLPAELSSPFVVGPLVGLWLAVWLRRLTAVSRP